MAILGVEDEGVEVSVEVVVKDEEIEEEEETEMVTGIKMVKEVKVVKVKDRGQVKVKGLTLVIRLNVIKIPLHSSPVSVTGPLANLHIFVWNQQPVLGRSSGFQSLINEILTSSTIAKILN